MLGDSPRVAAPGDFTAPDFDEEIVWSGLTHPMVVEFAADGRVFVAEKSGIIKVFQNLEDQTASTYANISANVHDFWDRGLLGMALDPDFTSNGRMYLSYTHGEPLNPDLPSWGDGCPSPPGDTDDGCVVSGRLSVLTNGGNEDVLIEDWCQQYPSHSMSDIVFDGDGALIVNSGDGANFNAADWGQWGGTLPNSTNPVTPRNPCGDPPGGVGGAMSQSTGQGGGLRSQDIRSTADSLGLSGTIIRVDPDDGDAMADNPGTGGVTTNTKKIVAYGLRNPFRMAIHPDTGELFVGDVGWGTWEEINRIDPDGAEVKNFGWPCREGVTFEPPGWDETNMCTSMPTPSSPFLAYQHGPALGGGCAQGTSSISGLAFYEGGPYPDAYDNALFFTDYSRQCIWVMRATGPGGDPAGVTYFGELAEPVHLTVGPGGDLFYADFSAGTSSGTIRRIVYSFDNDPPVADVDADPTSGGAPLNVEFDASGSSDPNEDPLTYAWDFGDDDGAFDDAFEVDPEHTYDDLGTYTARVRVSDGRGFTDTDQVTINVGNALPNAVINTPSASFTWSVGQTISFSGSGTDPDEGALPASAMDWRLIMHHCPSTCHQHVIDTWNNVSGGSFTAPDHEYPSHLELRLTVTDEHGATDVASRKINPKTVTLQVRSAPSGLRVSAAGRTATTPFNVTVLRGSRVVLGIPSGQTVDGFDYAWTSWSQGGPKTQTIRATASATYTARFDGGFDDVPPGAKFASDIAYIYNEGITVGCSDSPPLFCPTGRVTRGQMATFLTRAIDLPPTSTDYFTDDETNLHEGTINRLRRAEITFGCTATTFCPDGLVTRGQMASFLVRSFDLPATSRDYFTDDESNKHEANINRLRAAGITFGCGPTTYCPNGLVTRGQMAAFLHRALED